VPESYDDRNPSPKFGACQKRNDAREETSRMFEVGRSGIPSGCGKISIRGFRWYRRTSTTGYLLATLRVGTALPITMFLTLSLFARPSPIRMIRPAMILSFPVLTPHHAIAATADECGVI